MTRANMARNAGDDFQARCFWLNAANILNARSNVSAVAWEKGPRGLDDIRVEYSPSRSTPVGPISRDQMQCKWHVRNGEFGYEALTQPSFVNAHAVSWLQRAYDAFKAAEDRSVRFQLLTNWRVAINDPLNALIRRESGALDIDKLFTGKTTRSAMGKLRDCWQSHLSIDDTGLRAFAACLSFSSIGDSMEELRQRLNDRLTVVGLKRPADHHSSYLYDDLIIKLHQQGEVEFDEPSLRALCDREELWDPNGAVARPYTLGIRSFMHRFDALDDRCDQLLDLVPNFDGRYLRPGKKWNVDIEPKLTEFLQHAVSRHSSLRLVIDAHISVAVAVGRILDVKAGRSISIEQRTPGVGREDWEPNTGVDGPPALLTADGGEGAVVLALSITHDVLPAVRAYAEQHLPKAHVLQVKGAGGASALSIVSGAHAWQIVEQLASELRTIPGVPGRQIHLFAAAPNGLAFFLGRQLGLGPITVYEWDFEGSRGGGYQPGISLA